MAVTGQCERIKEPLFAGRTLITLREPLPDPQVRVFLWEVKMDQFEQEELEIERMEAEGEITSREATRMLTELARDYRAAAEESAQEAYDNEYYRWTGY